MSRVTSEEKAAYGTDLISMVQRAAADAVEPWVANLQQENRQLRQRMAQSDHNETYRLLDEQIGPAWRSINVHPVFLDFLALPDEYSGRPRREWLTAAFERGGDAARVVAIFRDFISTHPELFSAAGNNRARQERTERPVTPADLARFYERVRKGEISGAAKDAEEARLHAAIHGRR